MRGKIARVAWEWATGDHPPDPDPEELSAAEPDLSPPEPGELRVTWIGHATALIRLPGLTLLTDPVFSERCSPLPFWGPKRFVPPVPSVEALPEVDGVLLSHDHYDHLDHASVVALNRRFGDRLTWYTPLGYRDWFRRRDVAHVRELDWWEDTAVPGGWRVVCLPARHWTRRHPLSTNTRLWSGWAVLPAGRAMDTPMGATEADRAMDTPHHPPRLYFAGDSAWCPAFAEIGERVGPFDVSLIPVGAYEPRWFMKASHMNPEEAVRAYRALGAQGAFVPVHWGAWRLTFEDPLEPPRRARAAWAEAGLPEAAYAELRRGETLTVTGRPPG